MISKVFTSLFGLSLLFLVSCSEDKATIFELVDSKYSGITFSNDLEGADSLVALSFEYVYNGAGIAVEDFNRDGLKDLFFNGNMVDSKLYFNKGDIQFIDVTEDAGIKTKGIWSNGVTTVDINSDGWPDIYVSVGGLDKAKRHNLLFINQKNGKFTEEATRFGIDDDSYTIQSLFFDFDSDGDQDLYLLNTEIDPYSWTEFRPRRLKGEATNTDNLYRNNGDGTFTDISDEAGITIEGYGLGIAVNDFNNDQLLDLYIANDFLSNDIMYINNGDGTFTDKIHEYLDHTSRNSMGIDIQDFNNDGHDDIMTLDMLPQSNKRQKTMFGFFNYDKFQLGLSRGYLPQYPRNTLQLNNGNGSYSEIGQLAGVDKTDWSWACLFADFDNDGYQDLFVSNGYRQDITNMDFATYSRQLSSSPIGTDEAKKEKMIAKLNELPEIKLPNFIYKNTRGIQFNDVSKEWGIELESYSNGAVYADLDNDGDLDLVVNNIDQEAFVYKNTLNESGVKSNFLRVKLLTKDSKEFLNKGRVTLFSNNKKQTRFNSQVRGYLSSVDDIVHFGLGENTSIDSLVIDWFDGTKQTVFSPEINRVLEVSKEKNIVRNDVFENKDFIFSKESIKGLSDYIHKEEDHVDFKIQPILPHKHSHVGPALAAADVNGDNLEDIIVGSSDGESPTLYIQEEDGIFEKSNQMFSECFDISNALFFDVDNDGDQDLYFVNGGSRFEENSIKYQDQLYINNGLAQFERYDKLPKNHVSSSLVIPFDFDNDGDLDLFIGGRVCPGQYPKIPKSILLENNSDGKQLSFKDISRTLPNKGYLGMVTDGLVVNLNKDDLPDIMIVGEWMPITSLINEGSSEFKLKEIENSNGWWNAIAAGDFNKDGNLDFIAGNLGLNSRYKASVNHPLKMYGKDFDRNGRIDPVICQYIEDDYYIAHSRDMLIKQINSMRVRFKRYDQYGSTSFYKSFTKDELKGSIELNAFDFKSSVILSKGNGEFDLNPLPDIAQIAPINDILVLDIDNDKSLDLLLGGNSYSTEIMLGQYDASKGSVLKGDGQGHFTSLKTTKSGFHLDGEIKSMIKLDNLSRGPLIVAGQNRGKLIIHRLLDI